MTREEAITLIKSALKTMYLPKSKEYISDLGYALEMAIKALEQSYNSVKTELKPCEDAISRTEVIKSIDEREDVIGKVDAESVRTDIVLMQPVNPQPSGDMISRQSAIFLASDLKQDLPDDERIADMVMAHNEGVSEYQTQLSLLPSVTPQPKSGEWIGDAKTYYEELNKRGLGVDEYTPYFTDDIACSECLAKYSMLDNETQFFKYCPNCGARMVEPQERSEE